MKPNSKCKLSDEAPLSTCAVIGSDAVLTVHKHVAGVVFVQQDRTGEEYMLSESEVEPLDAKQAAFQAGVYESHFTTRRRG